MEPVLPPHRSTRTWSWVALSVTALLVALLPFRSAYVSWVVANGYGIATDDIWLDYVKGVLWAVFLGATIFFWPVPSSHKRVLTAAWVVRCLVALVVMIPYEGHYGRNLDALGYYRWSVSGLIPWKGFVVGEGTQNMMQIVRLHNLVLPVSYHAMKITFAMVGFIGVYLFYRAAARFLGRDVLFFLALMSVVPSIVFWSSVIGKDPLALLFLGAATLGIVSWARGHGGRWLGLTTVAAVGLLGVRFWLIPMLVVPMAIFAVHRVIQMRPLRLRVWVMAGGAAAFLVLIVGGFLAIGVHSPESAVAKINNAAHGFVQGGSSDETRDFSTLGDAAGYFPVGVFTALFRPFPGEVVPPILLSIPVEVENALLCVLVVAALLGAGRRELRDPLLQWAILFISAWTSFYAFISYNLGSSVRFKLQVLPVLLAVCLYLAIPPARLPGVVKTRMTEPATRAEVV